MVYDPHIRAVPRFYYKDEGGRDLPIYDRLLDKGENPVARVHTKEMADRIVRLFNADVH